MCQTCGCVVTGIRTPTPPLEVGENFMDLEHLISSRESNGEEIDADEPVVKDNDAHRDEVRMGINWPEGGETEECGSKSR